MKKLSALILAVWMIALFCVSAFAGDIPEALSYEDDAKVFIGTLVNFSNSPLGDADCEKEVTVIPTSKIKGEVEVGKEEFYEYCNFGKDLPENGSEYLFGWLSNTSVYAYKVVSRTEDNITLHITDEFSEWIQNYLDEGLYEQAEIARMNVGRKMTLSNYLETTREITEKVTFSLNGTMYDVDVEDFFNVSDKILITDVKDRMFKRMGAEDWAEDILYITVTHRQDTLYDGFSESTYACVSRFCEVDRYSQMMSRLPNCDFTMEWEDLASLYELLPNNIQKELYAKNTGETPSAPIPVISVAVAVLAILAIGFVVCYSRKKQK